MDLSLKTVLDAGKAYIGVQDHRLLVVISKGRMKNLSCWAVILKSYSSSSPETIVPCVVCLKFPD